MWKLFLYCSVSVDLSLRTLTAKTIIVIEIGKNSKFSAQGKQSDL